MTVKLSGSRERLVATLGCVVLFAAAIGCNNDPAPQESGPISTGGTPAPQNGGSSGKPASGTAGAGGRSTTTSPVQQASAGAGSGGAEAGRAAAGRGGSAGAAAAGRSGSDSSAAGSGGQVAAAGSGGSAGSAGAPDAGSADVKPPCLAKPSQMVVVGDSYLNWITHTFPDDFRSEFGEYRMYAVGGASMGSGGIAGFIPDQFTMAVADDPDIVATVMTGGGNDILIADTVKYPGSDTCKDRLDAPMDKVCQDVIGNAIDTAGKLMDSAAAAGVQDVVYLFYPNIPGGGFGGMNPGAILTYSLPLARDLCEKATTRTDGKLRCHFIDLVPVFEGHTDWFADDGIHENSLGSAAMAKEVVKVLKEKCVAQPASSGCCTP